MSLLPPATDGHLEARLTFGLRPSAPRAPPAGRFAVSNREATAAVSVVTVLPAQLLPA